MSSIKKKTFDEWAKPSIDSGKFIADDAMLMLHYNTKAVLSEYLKAFPYMAFIKYRYDDERDIVSNAAFKYRKFDGRDVSCFIDFWSLVMDGISSVASERKITGLHYNDISRAEHGFSITEDWQHPTVEPSFNRIDLDVYNDFIIKNYGEQFNKIITLQNEGYNYTEISEIVGGSNSNIGRIVNSRRLNTTLLSKAYGFLQRNI